MKGGSFATTSVGPALTTLPPRLLSIQFTHAMVKKTCSSDMVHRSMPESCRIWINTNQGRPSTVLELIFPGCVFVSVFRVYGAVTGRGANIVTATTPAAPYLRAVWLHAMHASADLIAKTPKLRLSLLGKP